MWWKFYLIAQLIIKNTVCKNDVTLFLVDQYNTIEEGSRAVPSSKENKHKNNWNCAEVSSKYMCVQNLTSLCHLITTVFWHITPILQYVTTLRSTWCSFTSAEWMCFSWKSLVRKRGGERRELGRPYGAAGVRSNVRTTGLVTGCRRSVRDIHTTDVESVYCLGNYFGISCRTKIHSVYKKLSVQSKRLFLY